MIARPVCTSCKAPFTPANLRPGRPIWARCMTCTLGGRRAAKFTAQRSAVDLLPPMPQPTSGLAFRVAGSPRSWNNALSRGRGRTFLMPWAREYKRAIAVAAVFRRPPGWSLAGRYEVQIESWFAQSTSDADGPVKLVLDALQGVVWANDRQVASVRAVKNVDRLAPRLEVTIRVVE